MVEFDVWVEVDLVLDVVVDDLLVEDFASFSVLVFLVLFLTAAFTAFVRASWTWSWRLPDVSKRPCVSSTSHDGAVVAYREQQGEGEGQSQGEHISCSVIATTLSRRGGGGTACLTA